jgi:AAA15 family ATPase/GTPase
MIPQEFRVTKFKCIDDTGWVNVENVTCLIGKNQSGKTAFLEAIKKLNPVYGRGDYEPYEEYPRDEWTQYKQRHEDDPAVAVRAKFWLEGDEITEIEREFGDRILVRKQKSEADNDGDAECVEVEVAKNYKNELLWDIDLNEDVYIEDLLGEYDLPGQTKSKLATADTIDELVTEIGDSTSDNEALNQILDDVSHGDIDIAQDIGSQFLESRIPQFLYMGEYHFLQDEISMDQLVKKQKQDELEEGDEIFLSLLSISNLEAKELRDNDNWARIRTDLEAAANEVTDYVLDYWSQNQNIRFQFDRNYLPGDTSFKWENERVVEVLVENLDYRATIPFNQQSRGFRWFFSVFCQFTDLKNQDKDLVVLLDEPGLHLHARAQQDFLNFLKEELSPQYPVIYTTHSPFMIDPRGLHRAKMVVSDPNRGTNISDDVMRIGEDTRLPLQNVFEFDLVDTLLIRPQTLLVEGKSDHSYLYTMSEILEDQGRTGLDRRWTVIPVGSGSNVPTFVSLFGGNDLDIAVLLDADSDVHQRVADIENRGVMDTENIRDISDIIDKDYGDIEDLFSTEFYMEVVNRAYSGELAQVPDVPDYITTTSFKEDNQYPRIARRLDTYFERFHINEGRFEHNKPAKYFQDHRERLKDELDDESVENFEALFKEFNSILTELESSETSQ